MNSCTNDDFDKLLSYLDKNLVKQATVNIPIDIFNMVGKVMKTLFTNDE